MLDKTVGKMVEMSRWIRCGGENSKGFVQSTRLSCLSHDFLIAKLEAYGLDIKSLRLMYKRVYIGSHRSTANKMKIGIPQGSVLGRLLFNIFINGVCVITT